MRQKKFVLIRILDTLEALPDLSSKPAFIATTFAKSAVLFMIPGAGAIREEGSFLHEHQPLLFNPLSKRRQT